MFLAIVPLLEATFSYLLELYMNSLLIASTFYNISLKNNLKIIVTKGRILCYKAISNYHEPPPPPPPPPPENPPPPEKPEPPLELEGGVDAALIDEGNRPMLRILP